MRRRALLSVLAALWPLTANGQAVAPPIRYETFTLPNGLKVVVHEDHSAPIVAVVVQYDVGAANEVPGRSGFAHLFEHMLFQETSALKKGQFQDLLEAAGADDNGTTTMDRTQYYQVVPSNRVNLALWLGSEQMARLVVTDENFKREREVVKEERRTRYDNVAYAAALQTLDTLHTDYRPYRRTVIGSLDDLNAASPADALTFYKQFYVPNNAAIVLAGDITLAQARKMVVEYFGSIPRGPAVPELPTPPAAPRTDGERRAIVEDKLATVPLVAAGYNSPPHRDADTYALALLTNILGRGESSRLNQRLVRTEKVATIATTYFDSKKHGGYVGFQARPAQGADPARVEQLMWEEVEKIRNEGVTEAELAKAKRQFIAGQIINNRQTVLTKAEALQHSRFAHDDVEAINADLDRHNAVTRADIQRVAQKYLIPANRTVVTILPVKKTATG